MKDFLDLDHDLTYSIDTKRMGQDKGGSELYEKEENKIVSPP